MSEYFYSASSNAFYPSSLFDAYEESGTWPADAVAASDEIYQEFAADSPPDGKTRVAGGEGLPVWGDLPGSNSEELVSSAQRMKARELSKATLAIAPLQDAVDLGRATKAETEKLNRLKNYRVDINRIDVNKTSDIVWPKSPFNI